MSHTDEPVAPSGAPTETSERLDPPASASGRNMLPARERRGLGIERGLMRAIATCGIVGVGVALGAILVSSKVDGWITGLVVSVVSVVLSAILWSSRQL